MTRGHWLILSWIAMFLFGLAVGGTVAKKACEQQYDKLNAEYTQCSIALKHELELFENCMRDKHRD